MPNILRGGGSAGGVIPVLSKGVWQSGYSMTTYRDGGYQHGSVYMDGFTSLRLNNGAIRLSGIPKGSVVFFGRVFQTTGGYTTNSGANVRIYSINDIRKHDQIYLRTWSNVAEQSDDNGTWGSQVYGDHYWGYLKDTDGDLIIDNTSTQSVHFRDIFYIPLEAIATMM